MVVVGISDSDVIVECDGWRWNGMAEEKDLGPAFYIILEVNKLDEAKEEKCDSIISCLRLKDVKQG